MSFFDRKYLFKYQNLFSLILLLVPLLISILINNKSVYEIAVLFAPFLIIVFGFKSYCNSVSSSEPPSIQVNIADVERYENEFDYYTCVGVHLTITNKAVGAAYINDIGLDYEVHERDLEKYKSPKSGPVTIGIRNGFSPCKLYIDEKCEVILVITGFEYYHNIILLIQEKNVGEQKIRIPSSVISFIINSKQRT